MIPSLIFDMYINLYIYTLYTVYNMYDFILIK